MLFPTALRLVLNPLSKSQSIIIAVCDARFSLLLFSSPDFCCSGFRVVTAERGRRGLGRMRQSSPYKMGKVTLSQYRGQVVVLNLATWCPPCVERCRRWWRCSGYEGEGRTVLAVSGR